MEKELSKKYYYNPSDFNIFGRRKSDDVTFRNVIKEFEYDFHETYSTEYALNLYANSRTMALLAESNDAAPFLVYGMDLTQGKSFDAVKDPLVNHEMEKYSQNICVYGIDSAFMTEFDEFGYENVVFLTKQEARSLQIKARLSGRKLSIQHGYDGELWCYKHEISIII